MIDVLFRQLYVWVKIIGKGDKERIAYLRAGALRAMKDWLLVRGQEPGALFCVIN